jgi:hypothetical protein
MVLGPLRGLPVGSRLACPAGQEGGHGLQLALDNCLARGPCDIRIAVRPRRAAGARNTSKSSTVMPTDGC